MPERRRSVVLRAVQRACSVTLSNWATTDEVAAELAKEAFGRNVAAELEQAWDGGNLAVGYPGGVRKWRVA